MAIRAYFDEPVAVIILPCLTGFPERFERAFAGPKLTGSGQSFVACSAAAAPGGNAEGCAR